MFFFFSANLAFNLIPCHEQDELHRGTKPPIDYSFHTTRFVLSFALFTMHCIRTRLALTRQSSALLLATRARPFVSIYNISHENRLQQTRPFSQSPRSSANPFDPFTFINYMKKKGDKPMSDYPLPFRHILIRLHAIAIEFDRNFERQVEAGLKDGISRGEMHKIFTTAWIIFWTGIVGSVAALDFLVVPVIRRMLRRTSNREDAGNEEGNVTADLNLDSID